MTYNFKYAIDKQNEPMVFVTFEDETDIFECVMFPKVFAQFSDLLNWEKLFIIRGKVEEDFGVYTVNVEKLTSLGQMIENSRASFNDPMSNPAVAKTRHLQKEK